MDKYIDGNIFPAKYSLPTPISDLEKTKAKVEITKERGGRQYTLLGQSEKTL